MLFSRKVRLPEIVLFIVAAVVPVIVRAVRLPVPPELELYHTAPFVEDVFSFHKSWVLALCAGIIIFHGLSDYVINWPDGSVLKQKIYGLFKNPVIIMVGVYLLFVLASNIFSPYTHTVLWGVHDRREGLFVQLAYITIFLATMYYIREKADSRLILAGFLVSSLIMGGIGFSQFINRDFFHTSIAAWLVTGDFSGFLRPDFTMSYGTNFNPNTFGLVTAMLTPLLFAAAVSWPILADADEDGSRAGQNLKAGSNSGQDSKLIWINRIWRGLFLLAGGLMAAGVVGSRSVGGFIGAGTAVLAIVVTLVVRWLVNRQGVVAPRKILITGAITVAVVIGSGLVLMDYIYENLSFTIGRIAAIFVPPDMSHLPQFTFAGTEMSVEIEAAGVVYHVNFPTNTDAGADPSPEVTVNGYDGARIALLPQVQREEGTEESPARYVFTYAIPGLGDISVVHFAGSNVYQYRGIMMVIEEGTAYLWYRGPRLVDPNEPIPSWGFRGWETWGSNRGYIFARTIPLLAESWLIGSGSDTFLLQFPTHDILSNYRYFGNPYILVDKAHNLYLQTAVTTGIISALALIVLFAYYIITQFWSLIRRPSEIFWLRLGIFAAVCAFSVSSLSTDSTVSSTPMFWIIIGLGFTLRDA